MQIFWISGPVGEIKSFNLSFKTIASAFLIIVLLLLAAGSALQFFGFRVALEYDPEIARKLGNLYTANELESLSSVYYSRLQKIENEHNDFVSKVKELEATNTKLREMLVPKSLLKIKTDGSSQGGQESIKSSQGVGRKYSLLDTLAEFHTLSSARNKHMARLLKRQKEELSWLEGLPIGLPVSQSGRVFISSDFGERFDPITRRRSTHTGIDFSAQLQTPILAAGTGLVVKAEWDKEYGNQVVISHNNGVLSRYAHASELLVMAGSKVFRGQVIAKSGNTGRSTGPHLHFEVIRNNQPVDPMGWLAVVSSL